MEVDLLLHPDVVPDEALVERVASVTGLTADQVSVAPSKFRVTTETGRIPALSEIDEIREIQPVPDLQLFNSVARGILNADVSMNGSTYDGAGQIVAVADTGFDTGDPASPHPAFTGRVHRLYALGRTAPPRADDPNGHGTHVAGSVLGDGVSPTMGGAIRGTAPAARLVLQSLLSADGRLRGIPADLNDLFRTPYRDGARVHTNSWGSVGTGLPYDTSSREIDEFVWNHPDQVICFAAGNGGSDTDRDGTIDPGSLGSQAAAKNCITVGASESSRPRFVPSYGTYWPSDFPEPPIRHDRQADNVDGMAAFSDRGPTAEGRVKPDVVAPGTCILSTRSRRAADGGDFGTSSDPLYFFSTGTSMATPLVAGCAAVVRQSLVDNGVPDPSAALIKAMLVNGAVELAGQYNPTEASPSPNNSSGWGRVDLGRSILVPGEHHDAGVGEGGPLRQGEQDEFVLDVGDRDDGEPDRAGLGATLKITLVWSDPPGRNLQNDLDLIVIAADGTERHGNMGTGDGFDRANNVEQVVWESIPPGPARVVIVAHRITQFPQPYAYAWRRS